MNNIKVKKLFLEDKITLCFLSFSTKLIAIMTVNFDINFGGTESPWNRTYGKAINVLLTEEERLILRVGIP